LVLSGSEIEEWLQVKNDLRLALDEVIVRQIMEPRLLKCGKYGARSRICTAAGVFMNNFTPLVPTFLRYSTPDSLDGAPPESIVLPVRDVLNKVIKPSSSQPHAPILPNVFLAFKGPGCEERVAIRQVLLDCAYGVRGIEALESLAMLPLVQRYSSGNRGQAAGRGCRQGRG
jgi:hypothetical protein